MKQHGHISNDPQVLAVVHRAGGKWNALIARVNGSKPSLVDTRTFAAADVHRLDAWFDEHRVARVLVVLPASSVVCRTCTLPDSDSAQLTQALALQAEAHVAALAPPHRIASAVLHPAPEETTRCGLMIAWPEAAEIERLETSRPVRYTSDVVALASLINGERPDDPLVWLDRADGSLAFAMTHANGAAFRCTREDAESTESWQRNVGRALTETGLNVGHTDAFIDHVVRETEARIASLNGDPAALFLPDDVVRSAATRVEGAETDAPWWRRFGVAVGALLARCDQLKPLTELQDAPPVDEPSVFRTAIEALSRPRTAAWCTAVAVFMLLFGPMLVHGLRLAVLEWRFGDIQSQLNRVEELRNKHDMYAELGESSWPMTKLLSDLATNTPAGIELSMIRITYDDSVSVAGVATPHAGWSATEVIAQMQRNLEETYIFSGTALNWDDPNNFGHYEFSLSAQVTRPYRIAKYEVDRDFAAWTMQMRVDGEKPAEPDGDLAADSAPSSAAGAPSEFTGGAPMQDLTTEGEPGAVGGQQSLAEADEDLGGTGPRRNTRRQGSNERAGDLGSRAVDRGAGDAGLPPSVDIPEALTEQQIKAMSLEEVQVALERVASARQHARLDSETDERLKQEFRMLLRQMRELKNN